MKIGRLMLLEELANLKKRIAKLEAEAKVHKEAIAILSIEIIK